MNIISFDIEEWYIEKVQHGGRSHMYAKYEKILNNILESLDENKLTATFFCLGKIAEEFPHIIKLIASKGHEIGSHSNAHDWVNKLNIKQFREDTYRAINALQDISGQKILSFRAPAFSITEANKWAFEILAENGIVNDASIFPTTRDFGGYRGFPSDTPCKIKYNGITLNEFPIPLYKIPIVNKNIPFSGGGYFRLLPYSFVKNCIKRSEHSICYFHIEDFLKNDTHKLMTRQEYEDYFKETGTLIKRISRHFKSNVGRGNSFNNFQKLLKDFHFTSINKFSLENKEWQLIEL